MGRYYSGDIQGKFWFGVQSSNDAEFFGIDGSEPSFIEYYADEGHLPEIEAGVAQCEKELGKHIEGLDKFFDAGTPYNDEDVAKAINVKVKEVKGLLTWYARLHLGRKILKCVQDNGQCLFSAEI